MLKIKRGQVTVFIIIGILLILTISLLIVLLNSSTKKPLENVKLSETQSIKSFVENCLEQATWQSISRTFKQGGYYILPKEVFKTSAYYLHTNKILMPTIDRIEKEVALGISEELLVCTNNFKHFKQDGIEITTSAMKSEVKFIKDKTISTINFPISVIKGEIKSELEIFTTDVEFKFPNRFNEVKKFLELQKDDNQFFLMGELSKLNDVVKYEQYENDIVIDVEYEEDITLNFVVNLNLEEDGPLIDIEEIQPPVSISYITPVDYTKAGVYKYKINAAGINLRYETSPNDLPINQDGEITIDTNLFPNNEYLYYVKVIDEDNQSSYAPFLFSTNINKGNLPVMKKIGSLKAKIGEEFTHQILTLNTNEETYFTSDSYLFEINNKTGEIKFTPSEEDRGVHSIRINAENDISKTWQRWSLEIE